MERGRGNGCVATYPRNPATGVSHGMLFAQGECMVSVVVHGMNLFSVSRIIVRVTVSHDCRRASENPRQ